MSELIDTQELTPTQAVDIYEGGVIWIHDNAIGQDIELDAIAATKLYDFLLLHMDRLHRHAQRKDVP